MFITSQVRPSNESFVQRFTNFLNILGRGQNKYEDSKILRNEDDYSTFLVKTRTRTTFSQISGTRIGYFRSPHGFLVMIA